MSLDVYLIRRPVDAGIAADLCEEHGLREAAAYLRSARDETVYESNITHNLGRMAEAAGIYKACWRPEEIGVTTAGQLVPMLEAGLARLRADPDKYRAFDASNGWGTYQHFVPWVEKYLEACREYPEAEVEVSR